MLQPIISAAALNAQGHYGDTQLQIESWGRVYLYHNRTVEKRRISYKTSSLDGDVFAIRANRCQNLSAANNFAIGENSTPPSDKVPLQFSLRFFPESLALTGRGCILRLIGLLGCDKQSLVSASAGNHRRTDVV